MRGVLVGGYVYGVVDVECGFLFVSGVSFLCGEWA